MPIVHFHLAEGAATRAAQRTLVVEACRLYAEVLGAPIERVRALITEHRAEQFAVAGEITGEGAPHAPYFECIVLDGRPAAERHRLIAGFTDLLAGTLGVSRGLVRGSCRRVDPEDWGIGGVPASGLRRAEIDARAAAAEN